VRQNSMLPVSLSSVLYYLSVQQLEVCKQVSISTVSTCRPPHKFVPTTTHVLLVCTQPSACSSPDALASVGSVCRRAEPYSVLELQL
jgi:hypothetical protein